jgi:hypothetical protein
VELGAAVPLVEEISDEDADGSVCRLFHPRPPAAIHRMPLSQGNNIIVCSIYTYNREQSCSCLQDVFLNKYCGEAELDLGLKGVSVHGF